MGLKVGTVTLEIHNPNWKNEFEQEKELLKDIFGDYAKTIEHVGSTSISGLSAKPIIDIAIGINNLKDFSFFKDKITNEQNHSIKEDSVDEEILVIRRINDDTTHLIHVMEIDGSRYKDTILFRDYLITHQDELRKYEKLKKELADKYAYDRKTYTSSKNEFISKILEKARNIK